MHTASTRRSSRNSRRTSAKWLAPSGEKDVRPVSFQGADGARSCWQLPAAQVRALDGLRGAQLDYEEAQAEQIRAAIQAP